MSNSLGVNISYKDKKSWWDLNELLNGSRSRVYRSIGQKENVRKLKKSNSMLLLFQFRHHIFSHALYWYVVDMS